MKYYVSIFIAVIVLGGLLFFISRGDVGINPEGNSTDSTSDPQIGINDLVPLPLNTIPDTQANNNTPATSNSIGTKSSSIVSDNTALSYQDLAIECTGFGPRGTVDIRNQSAYSAFIQSHSWKGKSVDCDDYEFPEIDFNKYTLLGNVLPMTGCRQEVQKTVTRKNGNQIVYAVHGIEYGRCEPAPVYPNMILVPILSQNDVVTFESSIEKRPDTTR